MFAIFESFTWPWVTWLACFAMSDDDDVTLLVTKRTIWTAKTPLAPSKNKSESHYKSERKQFLEINSKFQITSFIRKRNMYQVTGSKKQPTIIEYIKFSNKFHNASNNQAIKHA